MLVIQPHPTYPFSIPAQSTWMERHSLPHMSYRECRKLVLESLTWNVFPCSRPSLTRTTAHQILWCNSLMGPPSPAGETPGGSRGPGRKGNMEFPSVCGSWIPPDHTAQLPESVGAPFPGPAGGLANRQLESLDVLLRASSYLCAQ